MKILVLGGTRFVGRHLVQAGLDAGHQVTLFNRGQSNPELFPETEKLRGDRAGDLAPLREGTWDAVIDVSGYLPGHVSRSAELLKGRAASYLFISSAAVYRDKATEGQDEGAPVERLEDDGVEEITGETYGGLKALCESAVELCYPERAIVLRPGYVVGPYDTSDRFTYWVRRVARGGLVLAPGDPRARIQFIDGRDLANWAVRLLEQGAQGVFNAVGPAEPLAWGDWLATIRSAVGAEADFIWADEDFLVERGAHRGIAFSDLPLWSPSQYRGISAYQNAKALAAGLRLRPIVETITDVHTWDRQRDEPLRTGVPPELEKRWLDEWHSRSGS